MKNISLTFLPVMLFAGGSIAQGQSTYQWDTNSDAAGLGSATNNITWNTTDARWDLVGTGADDGTDATVPYDFATGDTAIFGGTAGSLNLGVGNMLPNILVQTGGYVFSVGGNSGRTFSGDITIAPTGITRFQAGNNSSRTFNGEIKLNGGTLKFTGGNNVINPNGGISGTGTVDYETSTRMIFWDNSYSGLTLLAGTETDIRHANAFGTSTVTITGGAINARVSGVTVANNQMNWDGNFGFTGTNALNLGTGAVTLGADVTVTTTANTLTVGGAIGDGSNGFGLTKAGAGTLRLDGSSTYTGATVVSAGTMLVNGSLSSSAVTVADGATLTYTGLSSFSAGTLQVDGSLSSSAGVTVGAGEILGGMGTITGDLSMAGTSVFNVVNLADSLAVSGLISLGSGFGIANLTGIDWDLLDLNTPYTIISTAQTFGTGDIGNFGFANAAPVGTGRQAYFTNGSLAVVVIPEPAAALLGGLGLLVLLRRRRN